MNRSLVAICAAALLCAMPALAQSPPLEFKGVPLGATEAQLLEKYPEFNCKEQADGGYGCKFIAESYRWMCNLRYKDEKRDACYKTGDDLEEFGPTKPTLYRVDINNGTIGRVSIYFPSLDFSEMVLAFTEKYGKPAKDAPGVTQNLMGATFQNRTVRWNRRDGVIIMEQRAGTVDNAIVTIEMPSLAQEEMKRMGTKAKAAAKKL